MNEPDFQPRHLKLATLWYACGALLLAGVAVLSLVPIPAGVPQVNDKLEHFLIYAVLSFWFSLLANGRRGLGLVIAGLVAFGLAIEVLQGMTPYRSAELADVLANGLGALVGLGVFFTGLPRLLRALDSRLAALVGR